MADVEEVAARFKSWAADNGILTYQPPEDTFERSDDQIDDLVKTNEAAAVSGILSHRKINLVMVSLEREEIIVCTHQKLTKKELETLPDEAEGGFSFRYVKAHPPQVKLPAFGGVGAGTFGLHNNRYACGSSVSVGNCVSAGTLGCLVKDAHGAIYGLTNNHVTGGCGYSDVNVPIVAPGLIDVRPGSHDPFTVGHHATVAPWVAGIPDNVDVTSNIDAAIFRIKDADAVTSMQRSHYDTPTQTLAFPNKELVVHKVGRTTGFTTGKMTAKSVGFEPVSMEVPQFRGLIYFHDLLMVENSGGHPFADRGDSGSLVVAKEADGTYQAVGLIFAVNADRTLTFVIPIDKVLKHFKVELIGAHNV